MGNSDKRASGAVTCECGEADGNEKCAWTGPESETVLIEYMPRQYRASHEAAGNAGRFPCNGAVRLRVHPNCARLILEDAPEWAEIIT